MEAQSDVANRIFGPKAQTGTPLLERSDHLGLMFSEATFALSIFSNARGVSSLALGVKN
jgi:hypothetical protein